MNMPFDTDPGAMGAAPTRSIGEHLRALGALRAGDEAKILAEQTRSGLPFGEAALRLGLIDAGRLAEALARQHAYAWPLNDPALAPELLCARAPESAGAEAFRDLRTQLMGRWRDQPADCQALAVVSPARGDGRSVVAANLAICFAQANLRTLLIDLDLRQPCQQRWFGRPQRLGVSSLLIGRGTLDEALGESDGTTLSVLGAGPRPPNPQELLGPGLLGLLMARLRQRFDVIVADTPAAAQASDAQLAAQQCGQALLVSRPHHAGLHETRALLGRLQQAGVQLLGATLNPR